MFFLLVNGKRTAMPIDTPLVYEYRDADSDDEDTIRGGYGDDLAVQVIEILKRSLQLTSSDFRLLRGVHADGQYQASTFQTKLYELLGMHRKPDPYFLLPWDASHLLDLAIDELHENSLSSNFIKRIIKRSIRLHTLFEYKTYSEIKD
ncbi:uncharacterized protein LOC124451149 [Xenia sp. Carnegie-2017]|uniref:uncharacterized protein LOC124451149 n=1 Tax=Xenia sp. Carnegie-2017 TaxID=2897299 RepID=UPI001F03F991|nr:uncharacterized protein LOC124451149 [Xenia sp. Carnegie-2017]